MSDDSTEIEGALAPTPTPILDTTAAAPTGQPPNPAITPGSALDLDAIATDLDDVQAALDRLNEGTYWTDEVTGEPLSVDMLAARPTARRV